MDGTESDAAREAQQGPDGERSHEEAEAHADRAAEGLRDQIAALRRQVKDAQETLRDHQRRHETRSFKR